jgi:hypothetical protein
MSQVLLFCIGAIIFGATVCASVLFGLQSFGRQYKSGRQAQLRVDDPPESVVE